MNKKNNLILGLVFILSYTSLLSHKIAIVSLYDSNFKEIGNYSDLNKANYAKLHNYDFYSYKSTLDNSRPTAWSKIKAIQKHIDFYDWVCWADADSLFMNKNIKLESLIDENYNLIISKDEISNVVNTGIFLIKNCKQSKKLLETIYNQEQFLNHAWWENMALIHVLENYKRFKNSTKIISQRLINSYPHFNIYSEGDFIVHFAGIKEKIDWMKNFYYKSLN